MSPDRSDGSLPFSSLARFVIPEETVDATLQRVAELAVSEVDDSDMAGITLMRDGTPETAVFTDVTAPNIDVAQYESDSGPCLDAFRDGVVYRIEDTASERRWPEFAAAAHDVGVRSTLSTPLTVGDSTIGALNFYSRHAGSFEDEALPLLFAAQAAVVLANSQAYWAAHHLATQLQVAMDSRAPIEQAKGVLMVRHGYDADAAFAALRQMSNDSNRKLRDVANDIVDSTTTDGSPSG
jgi:GAF domain-containing protein